MATEQLPVVVVGAGPYGLSLGAHLKARGIPHRVFGRPFSMWRERMPRGMLLRSEGCASNLRAPDGSHTLREFCAQQDLPYAEVGDPVPLETFVAYGDWFQRACVPQVEPLDVERVERADGAFRVRLSDGTETGAARVVVAVGVGAFAWVPPELEALPPAFVTHTSAHRDLAALAGRDVAVVGGGQSALETAALLHEAGARPRVLVRQPRVHWNVHPLGRSLRARLRSPQTALGLGWRLKVYLQAPTAFRFLPPGRREVLVRTTLGPSGAWWLRERVEDRVPLLHGVRVRAGEAAGGRLRLALERAGGARDVLEVDHVVAGTGYRVALERLGFLDPALREGLRAYGGFPLLTRDFESSVRGLYFVGLAAALTFGPLQRFVHGAGLACERVVAALTQAAAQRARPPAVARMRAAGVGSA